VANESEPLSSDLSVFAFVISQVGSAESRLHNGNHHSSVWLGLRAPGSARWRGHHLVDPPIVRNSFEGVDPLVFEREAGARDQILHGL
jgi:hypothetical protein